jgi:phosphoglycerate dehydrogenase-like enzyme
MTVPRVLIHSLEPQIAIEVLEKTHPDVETTTCTDDQQLSRCVDEFKPEIVFSVRNSGGVFPRAALVESRTVKWVSNAGSGVNHLMPWEPSKVTVTNSAGVAADMMAEYALGVMLHFSLDINGLSADKKNRHWQPDRQVVPIQNKIIALVGLGKTGLALARKAKALDMHVIGVRANPRATENVDRVYSNQDLGLALRDADYIVFCLPLLDSTRGLMGFEEFGLLKPQAVLIDVSRGGIVQEDALISALEQGRIRGAGLDVFETEPLPEDNPLWSFENVIISPHCSSVYQGWEKVSAQMFAENLSRWRINRALDNIVDPQRGY